MGTIHTEGLGETTGPGGKQPIVVHPSILAHDLSTPDRLDGSQQNRPGSSFRFSHDIHAVVIAVCEVNIRGTRSPPHDLAARRPTESVAGGIRGPSVGFYFHDTPDHSPFRGVMYQEMPQEVAGDP
jgi:hypothetical protein